MKEKNELYSEFLKIEKKEINFLPRVMLLTLVIIIILTFVFLTIVKNEVFSTSKGVLVYPGKLKVIAAPFSGIIDTIYIKEGDEVEVGQPLFKMNESIISSEMSKLKIMRDFNVLERYRLETLTDIVTRQQNLDNQYLPEKFDINWINIPAIKNNPSKMKIIERHYNRFHGEIIEVRLRKKNIEKDIQISKKNIIRLRNSRDLKYEKMSVYKKTYNKGISNILDLLDARIDYNNSLLDLDSELASIGKRELNIGILNNEIAQIFNQLLNQYSMKIEDIDKQLENIDQDIKKKKFALKTLLIRAPVAGKIHDLFIVTDGSGIEQAQKMASMVPRDEHLMVDVYVKSNDIGFVQKNQTVSVKVDSFPFTVYGLIKGQVVFISNDISYDVEHGLRYKVRVKLDKDYLVNNGNKLFVKAGMSVQADVHLTERRLISYLSSPMVKTFSESFKER